jgi:hypothetical protein
MTAGSGFQLNLALRPQAMANGIKILARNVKYLSL